MELDTIGASDCLAVFPQVLVVGSAPYVPDWWQQYGSYFQARGFYIVAINNAWVSEAAITDRERERERECVCVYLSLRGRKEAARRRAKECETCSVCFSLVRSFVRSFVRFLSSSLPLFSFPFPTPLSSSLSLPGCRGRR